MCRREDVKWVACMSVCVGFEFDGFGGADM